MKNAIFMLAIVLMLLTFAAVGFSVGYIKGVIDTLILEDPENERDSSSSGTTGSDLWLVCDNDVTDCPTYACWERA